MKWFKISKLASLWYPNLQYRAFYIVYIKNIDNIKPMLYDISDTGYIKTHMTFAIYVNSYQYLRPFVDDKCTIKHLRN